ncbi:MAG: hypothetical protein HQL99_15405 [Magnetococcales bacterium]|nr:hypothetical protein [Magnetococcales bacterium]
MNRIYRHKKTGKLYVLLAHAVDCTNERDGTGVLIYHPCDDGHSIYVREHEEFKDKFELVDTGDDK